MTTVTIKLTKSETESLITRLNATDGDKPRTLAEFIRSLALTA